LFDDALETTAFVHTAVDVLAALRPLRYAGATLSTSLIKDPITNDSNLLRSNSLIDLAVTPSDQVLT